MDVTMRVTLHGVAREITVPTALEVSGGKLVATAFFSINQTDFGIAPMSVLGGGLQVDNTVRVRMRIVARSSDARN
jgi:polyisoprenoid-binding protein YceI